MKFYSLFGLEEACRFRSGAARCAWLTGAATRLELIEVPSYVNATAAPDGLVEEAVGLNHLAFDVTAESGEGDLAAYLQQLNARSEARFRKSLRLALAPQRLRKMPAARPTSTRLSRTRTACCWSSSGGALGVGVEDR